MTGFEPLVFLFTIGVLYCWLGARLGAVVMQKFAWMQGWEGEVETSTARRVVFWALMAHAAVSAGMDFLTGTSQSLPFLIPTLDMPRCAPNCYIFGGSDYTPVVQSVGTYYAVVVGPGLANWLMYALWQVPGIVAAYFVIASSPWKPRGSAGTVEMFAASAVIVGIGLAVLMPLFVFSLLAWIESAQ